MNESLCLIVKYDPPLVTNGPSFIKIFAPRMEYCAHKIPWIYGSSVVQQGCDYIGKIVSICGPVLDIGGAHAVPVESIPDFNNKD